MYPKNVTLLVLFHVLILLIIANKAVVAVCFRKCVASFYEQNTIVIITACNLESPCIILRRCYCDVKLNNTFDAMSSHVLVMLP
jgi:hypothetical protein